MKDSTIFSFSLTHPVSQLSLEIFTLSGRKIHSQVDFSAREPGYYDDIIWYGNDYNFDPVGTGVYLYKAVAIPANGEETAESYGKLVLIK